MEVFEPVSGEEDIDDIIPHSKSSKDLESIRTEIQDWRESLGKNISGVGPMAAERYLLKHEYGFSNKLLAKEFGVTPPTISNQTNSVRENLLVFPVMAHTVGRFRSWRTELQEPVYDTTEKLWTGDIETKQSPAQVELNYQPGSYKSPFSWKYSLIAMQELEEKTRYTWVDYIIDDTFGVFLKRSQNGLAYNRSKDSPTYQDVLNYTVYPLPHPELPVREQSLLSALEHHVVYDVKKAFEEFDWSELEAKLRGVDRHYPTAPRSGRADVLLDRIRRENSEEPIREFEEVVYIRNNIEKLLRVYPLESPSDLPSRTLEILYNGPITKPVSPSSEEGLKEALSTFQISSKPGQRKL